MSEIMEKIQAAVLERGNAASTVLSAVGLEAIDLRKVYSDVQRTLEILNQVSLKVRKGEGVAILGPSGSGKTTLLNLLSGLDDPTSGQVMLDGVSIHELKAGDKARFINRNIGFIFQFYHLLPELTALENVMLPVWVSKESARIPEAQKKAKELLDRVGLKERMKHFPSELSGGEQQRVAIARALIYDPKFLFCDEPTGNLDIPRGEEIAGLLKKLFSEERKTVLIVTHDERIARMTDRVWHLVGQKWSATSASAD